MTPKERIDLYFESGLTEVEVERFHYRYVKPILLKRKQRIRWALERYRREYAKDRETGVQPDE